ncbi:MAG: polysaccharide deacetylase family protein [Candidatus Omnitrophica bacterium]|nr:polysaccharide deacetylase family protein [Candidatus Omnitrophota bacterium]
MPKVLKKIIFYLFIFYLASLAIFAGYIFSCGRDAAILMYHSIGEPLEEESLLNIPEEIFEKQIKFLYDHHYCVISLEELAGRLLARKPILPKTVVLTFDDGYENNYTKLFPILKKYNFPATIFIIVNYLGKEKKMDGQHFKFMTPQMAKEMSDSGLVTIGAHTLDHLFLPKIEDQRELKRQIFGSKAALEKMLGVPVNAFCYPVGGYNAGIEKLVRHAGYEVAVTTLPEQGYAHDDIYALKRIKGASRSWDVFTFFIKTSGYYLRMKEMNKK